jgi:hypothetical protein
LNDEPENGNSGVCGIGTPDVTTGPASPNPRKRPYVKPSFRFEGVFETTALACGKANPNQGQCKFVQKHS